MSRPDWSRDLLGTAEDLAAICGGSRQPNREDEVAEMAHWLRGRLAAWQPTLIEERTALDEAARAYVVAALRLYDGPRSDHLVRP